MFDWICPICGFHFGTPEARKKHFEYGCQLDESEIAPSEAFRWAMKEGVARALLEEKTAECDSLRERVAFLTKALTQAIENGTEVTFSTDWEDDEGETHDAGEGQVLVHCDDRYGERFKAPELRAFMDAALRERSGA